MSTDSKSKKNKSEDKTEEKSKAKTIDEILQEDIDESDSSESEEETIEVPKEFQEKVIKYINLDDLIRKKTEEIKELKNQRKPCEDYILEYLEKVGETTIDITGGKLIKNKSETKVPLSFDTIKDAISDKITDPKIIKEILTKMTDRPKKVNVNIKRTSKWKKNKKN